MRWPTAAMPPPQLVAHAASLPPHPTQNKASWYWRLARQAASWGWLVLQYDISGFPSAAAELHLFPEIVQASAARFAPLPAAAILWFVVATGCGIELAVASPQRSPLSGSLLTPGKLCPRWQRWARAVRSALGGCVLAMGQRALLQPFGADSGASRSPLRAGACNLPPLCVRHAAACSG